MALRIFNSTTPFKESKEGSVTGYLYSGEEVCSKRKEQKEDLLYRGISASVKLLLTQGTAKQVGAKDPETEKLLCFSIIAQEESEGPQEFSPTSTEHTYFRSHLINKERLFRERGVARNNVARFVNPPESQADHGNLPFLRPSRKRRKRQRRKRQREEEERKSVAPSVLSEQESSSSSSYRLSQEDAKVHLNSGHGYRGVQSLGVQETERPGSVGEELTCHFPPNLLPYKAYPRLSRCNQESGSHSLLSSVGEYEIALKALRYNVSQEDPCFAYPFFRNLEREAAREDCEGCRSDTNEGLLFHPTEQLRHRNYEYREGREFSLIAHIQSGSYGDVYSMRDNSTGFRCAAKKIPLSKFNSEELGSWSALDSPRMVELFGAVREGPNVFLFMDLKAGSLGQLLRERGRLPEDLALHYHCQILGALEHLHKRRILHLDVKADNVLLSEDGKDTFLCDFGHSERLGPNGRSTSAYRGGSFRGTETHMAPEVVKGEPRCGKADVWSSCCMLLHMLNGCHPWTRYYSHPLCLKIATEPPPLREIPPSCNPYTVSVLKAGLQKEPIQRASAPDLREKATRALKEVGGLMSPVKGAYQEPTGVKYWDEAPVSSRSIPSFLATCSSTSSVDTSFGQVLEWVSPWRNTAQEDDIGEEDETDWGSSGSISPGQRLLAAPCSRGQRVEQSENTSTVSEQELRKLSRDWILGSLSQPHPPELQEQLLSCLSSDCHSCKDPADKDSGSWSVSTRDDLSSGVFSSYSSETEESFNVDWLGSSHRPSLRCFEGVDVWIENFNGQCLRIRESPKVNVGHIATGISEQISEKAFSFETLDRQMVSHDQVVTDSGLWLRCVRAPDSSSGWCWRVREGVLETRE
ncbi:mitogen-activated protein kinase kinase kinase 14 [Scleropages formosus]|uniref:Mitogen-activated protein kinase kinase kinase 14-like n=1 Tax=Scleropages formosus TaxID=113540 RepID=A0A8C9R0W7_SCLFO|nr:mitogen-activated protein kinase kinase kinase 14-like [Scleropages formosus]XP_018597654.2 mitogen-activated protein kinase kinase kinase 14-like [Scleropages formosus]XP_018597655.2 mitogen-activated protein kinase kinase kinase 14-like [Scleropages formosus]